MGLAGTSATRTLVAPSAEVRSVNVRSGRPFVRTTEIGMCRTRRGSHVLAFCRGY